MRAIADTERLVEDGIITSKQAMNIETRSREAIVYLAINTILCAGIIAAISGLIAWLGTPLSVGIFGLPALVLGVLILGYGNAMYRMFGNASALIGAGMLIAGASLELMDEYGNLAGPAMVFGGLFITAATFWYLRIGHQAIRFVSGVILLMGLTAHLVGIAFVLKNNEISGALISLFFLYSTAVIIGAGLMTDVRLVTALAIVPFAQVLDTGTFYFGAYVFYSPESTLSIIQMILLIAVCAWISSPRLERRTRHARILANMAFIIANLCALVGSLRGDFVGETVWGSEISLYLSEGIYSVVWAVALLLIIFWAANNAQRGLFNAAITSGGIHAYTQFFVSFWDAPLAYVIGGFAAVPLAWSMWRLNHWMVGRSYQNAEPHNNQK